MSKLITAKEAVARCSSTIKSNPCFERYIEYINQQIRWAIDKNKHSVGFAIYDCDASSAAELLKRLHQAGYLARSKMARDDVACFEIGWGGS